MGETENSLEELDSNKETETSLAETDSSKETETSLAETDSSKETETSLAETDDNKETEKVKKQMGWKAVIALSLGLAALVIAGVAVLTSTLRGGSGPINTDYVSIPIYKGVEIEMEKTEVTDEDIETRIQGTLESNKITNEITDRPCQEGDFVNVSYTGSIGDEVKEDLSENNVEIELSTDSGMYKEEFIQGILGHSLKDEFDIPLSYPEDFELENLRGQTVNYHFVINEIYTKSLPELTDDFVKENIDGCKTVEEYKEKVAEEVTADLEESIKSTRNSLAWEALMKQATIIKYPDGAVDAEVDKLNNTYKAYAKQFGISLDDFITQYLGTDKDGYNKEVKNAAKETIENNLIVEAIAKREGLTPDKAEYQERLEALAKDYGYNSYDEFAEAYKDQLDEDELKMVVLTEKVQDWVGENAVVTEPKTDDAANDTSDEN